MLSGDNLYMTMFFKVKIRVKQNKVGLWSQYYIWGRSSEGLSSTDHVGEE